METRDVKGYEGLYKVTCTGEILNKRGHCIKQTVMNAGYYMVKLYKNGKGVGKNVHRIVAIAFLPNDDDKPLVNHKDGNRLNNDVNNLEWCTRSENMKHLFQIGLGENARNKARERMRVLGNIMGPKSIDTLLYYSSMRKRPVAQTTLIGEIVNVYESVNAAIRATNNGDIQKVLSGKKEKIGNYTWKYLSDIAPGAQIDLFVADYDQEVNATIIKRA